MCHPCIFCFKVFEPKTSFNTTVCFQPVKSKNTVLRCSWTHCMGRLQNGTLRPHWGVPLQLHCRLRSWTGTQFLRWAGAQCTANPSRLALSQENGWHGPSTQHHAPFSPASIPGWWNRHCPEEGPTLGSLWSLWQQLFWDCVEVQEGQMDPWAELSLSRSHRWCHICSQLWFWTGSNRSGWVCRPAGTGANPYHHVVTIQLEITKDTLCLAV